MVNPSQIKQSLNKDCMPTGFIYAGLALTVLSLLLQFRLVSSFYLNNFLASETFQIETSKVIL